MFSCSKEENEGYTKADLIGVWELKSITSQYGENEIRDECQSKGNIEFSEEAVQQNWYTPNFDGVDCYHLEINGNYTLDGKKIDIKTDTETDVIFTGIIISPTEIAITGKTDEGHAIRTYTKY